MCIRDSDNVVDWGSMVSETHHYLLSYPGLTLYPVLMIVVCTLSLIHIRCV